MTDIPGINVTAVCPDGAVFPLSVWFQFGFLDGAGGFLYHAQQGCEGLEMRENRTQIGENEAKETGSFMI